MNKKIKCKSCGCIHDIDCYIDDIDSDFPLCEFCKEAMRIEINEGW